eukprot:6410732-Prymnesium_polylepis.1
MEQQPSPCTVAAVFHRNTAAMHTPHSHHPHHPHHPHNPHGHSPNGRRLQARHAHNPHRHAP